MSWMDDELDKVFKEAAEQPVFEYKASYFADIEKQLPVKSKHDIAWWWTANAFLLSFGALLFMNNDSFDGLKVHESKVTSAKMNFNNASNHLNHAAIIEKKNSFLTNENDQTVLNVISANEKRIIQKEEVNGTSLNSSYIDKVEPFRPLNNFTNEASKASSSFIEEGGLIVVGNSETNYFSVLLPLKIPFIQHHSSELIVQHFPTLKRSDKLLSIGLNFGKENAWAQDENIVTRNHSIFSVDVSYSVPFKNVKLSAGISFQGTTLKDLEIKERTKLYGFGSTILDNSYQFSSIYSVATPIEISRQFGRHTLGIGIVPSMNLFTYVKHKQELDGIESVNEKGFTHSNLFNRFGLSPRISYGFSLSESIQLGLNVQLQLLQPLSSDRFIGQAVKMPLSGQLFIKKSLKF